MRNMSVSSHPPIIWLLIRSQQCRKHSQHHDLWGFVIIFFSVGPRPHSFQKKPNGKETHGEKFTLVTPPPSPVGFSNGKSLLVRVKLDKLITFYLAAPHFEVGLAL